MFELDLNVEKLQRLISFDSRSKNASITPNIIFAADIITSKSGLGIDTQKCKDLIDIR